MWLVLIVTAGGEDGESEHDTQNRRSRRHSAGDVAPLALVGAFLVVGRRDTKRDASHQGDAQTDGCGHLFTRGVISGILQNALALLQV